MPDSSLLRPLRRCPVLVTTVPHRAPKRLPSPPGRPILGWLLVALSATALVLGAGAALAL